MPVAFRDLRRPAALLAAASAIALAGCKIDNRPLLARGEPAAMDAAAAPAAGYPFALGPLDPSEPARIAPAARPYDGYALAERAYAYDRAAWQAPPDYGFSYGDIEPWAWQTAGDELMFAEPLDQGYRFYYYEPGEAYPYFVRDPYYGYAYGDDGVLSAVFNAAGSLLGSDRLYGMADVAGAYLNRGRDLRRVYYAEPHYALASDPVWYDRWEERYPVLRSAWDPWMAAADRAEPWRAYRASSGERELRAFDRERERRQREAAKFDRKVAKAEDKAWRHAIRESDRQAYVAYAPAPVATPRIEARRGHDDHPGRRRGQGHDRVDDRGPASRAVAVADNRPQGRRGDDHGGGRGGEDHGRGHGGDDQGRGHGDKGDKDGKGKGGKG